MHSAMSRIVARAATVVLLIAAMTVIGQHTVTAEAVPPPQDGYGFSVGAPMTYMTMYEYGAKGLFDHGDAPLRLSQRPCHRR